MHERAYDGLIALLEGARGTPVDALYVRYQEKHKVAGLVPGVASQNYGFSDIRGCVVSPAALIG